MYLQTYMSSNVVIALMKLSCRSCCIKSSTRFRVFFQHLWNVCCRVRSSHLWRVCWHAIGWVAELGPQHKEMHPSDRDLNYDRDLNLPDSEPLPPKLKNIREFMNSLEDAHLFLEVNGYTAEVTRCEELLSTVVSLQCSTTRYTFQSTLFPLSPLLKS